MANYIKGRLKERHAPSEHATARVHMQCKLFTVWSIRWKHGEMEKRLSEPFTRNSPSNCEAVVSQSAARSVPDIIVKSFEDLYTQHPDLFEVSASNWNLILSPVISTLLIQPFDETTCVRHDKSIQKLSTQPRQVSQTVTMSVTGI